MNKSVNTIKKELESKIELLSKQINDLVIDPKSKHFVNNLTKRDLLSCNLYTAKKKLRNIKEHNPILGKSYEYIHPEQ